jgi:osmotically-inducible protein OsmY
MLRYGMSALEFRNEIWRFVMKAGIVALFSALSLTASFAFLCFAQSNSYSSTKTTTTSTNSNMSLSGQPGTAATTASTSTENSANSWQRSINDAVNNAETVTEKAYNEVAGDVRDLSLVARIKAVLHENKSTRDSDVHVTADNGIVTITGSVPSEHNAQRVCEVVASVYGVKAVNNNLDYPHNRGFATSGEADSAGTTQSAHNDDTSTKNARIH